PRKSFTHIMPRSTSGSLQTFAADILGGPANERVLLLDRVNPVYDTPPGWRMRDALLKFSYIVSFASFVDDTSVLADLILPDHSFLESWTESRPESGSSVAVATVAGPAMKPLHDTRAMPDVLLEVARKIKPDLSAKLLPWMSFDQMLQAFLGDEAW